MADHMRSEHGLSIRRACRAVSLSRSVYAYQPHQHGDGPVIETLALADRYPRYGLGKMYPLARKLGHVWNHKRVHRVYCQLKLNLRRKGMKRLPSSES